MDQRIPLPERTPCPCIERAHSAGGGVDTAVIRNRGADDDDAAADQRRRRDLEFAWGKTPTVNGKLLNYAAWPLFGGPFAEAAMDSERLVLKHGKLRRTLDFRTLTVRDE